MAELLSGAVADRARHSSTDYPASVLPRPHVACTGGQRPAAGPPSIESMSRGTENVDGGTEGMNAVQRT